MNMGFGGQVKTGFKSKPIANSSTSDDHLYIAESNFSMSPYPVPQAGAMWVVGLPRVHRARIYGCFYIRR